MMRPRLMHYKHHGRWAATQQKDYHEPTQLAASLRSQSVELCSHGERLTDSSWVCVDLVEQSFSAQPGKSCR